MIIAGKFRRYMEQNKILFVSLLLFFIGCSITANAQTNDCIKDFDYLVGKIKADYPGYSVKVNAKTAPELKKLEQELRKKIQLYPDSCGKYLSLYAAWFKDNHLRTQRVRSSSNSASTKDGRKYIVIKADSLSILQSKKNTPEGVWHSYRGDIAIIKAPNSKEYSAVSISFKDYEKNQIAFTLTETKEGEYALVSFPQYNGYKPVKGKASLYLNDRVIELHGEEYFVRQTNSSIFDDAFLRSYLPVNPNGTNTFPLALQLSDSTFYIRVSSFAYDYAERTIKKYWSAVTSSPNLIIDIRNNGGGQDNYYQILADLIYTHPYESKGVEWYATENNIKMGEDAIKNGDVKNGEEGIRWMKTLVDAMKQNPGKFVNHPMMGNDQVVSSDTIYLYPKKVGIIINENNGSAAEQFLLTAKHSSKVTLFGNSNTAGVLDYSNAISENFPSNKYSLTFPMTRSRRLPDNPIDNIGIAPDVYIPYAATEQLFNRLDNWVYFVKDYLEIITTKK